MKANMKILSLLLLLLAASCKKEQAVAPAPVAVAQPKGEKVIFWGPNPEYEGAMIFQRMDGSFIRSKDYPKEVLNLKRGDVIYLEFKVLKTKSEDGAILGTPPVEIFSVSKPVDHIDMAPQDGGDLDTIG